MEKSNDVSLCSVADNDKLRDILRNAREERGWTAARTAEEGEKLFGKGNFISDKSIIQYENHNRIPTFESVMKLCAVYNIKKVYEVFVRDTRGVDNLIKATQENADTMDMLVKENQELSDKAEKVIGKAAEQLAFEDKMVLYLLNHTNSAQMQKLIERLMEGLMIQVREETRNQISNEILTGKKNR